MCERGGGTVGLQSGPVGDGRRGPAEVQVVEFADCVGELVADDVAQHLGDRDQEVSVFGGEQMVEGRLGVGVVAAACIETRQFGGLDEVAGDRGVGARLVPVGDEWMLSGPTSVLRPAERDIAYQLALTMALQMPEAVFRNPEKLALAWEHQRADRERFIRFFGADLVVLSGDEVQERLNAYHEFCRDETVRSGRSARSRTPARVNGPVVELPADMVESETVALIHDEVDGFGFYAEFGLVAEAFADPDLVRRRRWRERVLAYLHDDSVEPMVLRRLAERDPDNASVVLRRVLKRPRFEWGRDGEKLLRELKPEYFARPPRPRVSPVSDRLAAFAERR